VFASLFRGKGGGRLVGRDLVETDSTDTPPEPRISAAPPTGEKGAGNGSARRSAGLALGAIVTLAGVGLLYLNILRGGSSLPGALILGAGLVLSLTQLPVPRRKSPFERDADRIREAVNDSVDRSAVHVYGPDARVTVNLPKAADPAATRASDALQKQEAILREIYTQGLAQARASFRISIVFAAVGATFLFGGVALAILFARTTGQQYASIVAGTAGVVINLTSSLFFVQSNRARANMVSQGAQLREESRDDRRLGAARELAVSIEDAKLRNQIKAQISLLILRDEDELSWTAPPRADRPGTGASE
jgi:TRADD-N domain-containing protein